MEKIDYRIKLGLDEYGVYGLKNCSQVSLDLVPVMKKACNIIAEISNIKLSVEHFGLFLDAYMKNVFRANLKDSLTISMSNGEYTNDFSNKFRTITSREAIEICQNIDNLKMGVSVGDNDNTMKKVIFDVCAEFCNAVVKYLEEVVCGDNVLVVVLTYDAHLLFPGAKIEFGMGCPTGYFYDIGSVIYSDIITTGIKLAKEADKKEEVAKEDSNKAPLDDDENECGVYGVDF